MKWNLLFFINSVLFGVGLAMDAFSVSLANGLHEPGMNPRRMCVIAGTFGLFQILMPLVGWVCVHTIAELFTGFQRMIPWIALLLLGYIGGKMLLEGLRGADADETENEAVGTAGLLLQGVATSIDALSVGFTIAEYRWVFALTEAMIIGVADARIVKGKEKSLRSGIAKMRGCFLAETAWVRGAARLCFGKFGRLLKGTNK